MEQSKIISVDVDISLKKTSIRTLDALIFSRDVNAPKINFNITKDGNELADSTSVSLLLTASNSLGTLKDGLNIKLNGTVTGGEVTFALPNDILGYEGFVRADLYIYWEGGSNDGTQPILFYVKRSALDSTASTMSVVYVDEFEVEKARVTKAADDAVGTIDTNATIQQFEADKKVVSDAKDLAVIEIKARPDELDGTLAETRTKIEAIPAELDSAVSTAKTDITAKSDSVDQTASVAKNRINADVLAVDSNKDAAITAINAAPSKLDEPINNAKNAISQSVNNVSNVETGAVATINTAVSAVDSAKNIANDLFNQSVDDVQNASASAVSDIEAVKPDMIQQINDIETNINELVVLQQTNAIQKKIQTAWAWSVDGTDGFTTVYPNLNLLKGTKTPKSITGNNTLNQGGLLYSFDNNSTLNNQGFSANDTITLEFDWSATNPVSGKFTFQWNGQPWGFIVPTIRLSSTNGSGHVISMYNIRAADIASTAVAAGLGHRLDNVPTNTVITISNVIISKAKTSQPWMPSSSEVTTADYPKYRGIGVLSSVTPADYFWEQSDTYRGYKEQQLKTAIIALGGTL